MVVFLKRSDVSLAGAKGPWGALPPYEHLLALPLQPMTYC
jgi:hypothetical protein